MASDAAPVAMSAVTVDKFLGGKVEAVQAAAGHHRSGLEAVLLGAAIPDTANGVLIDLGSGVGVAGFCAAARAPALNVVLVERDPALLRLAGEALARPANAGFAARVKPVAADVEAAEAAREAAGLVREQADYVVMNPPFHDPGRARRAHHPGRAAAHVLSEGGLDPWFRVAASLLKPDGIVVAIFPADRLGDLLASVGQRFGALDVLPVHARARLPAHRVLLRGRKGRRGGVRIRPGLTLHAETGNHYLPAAEALLRHGAGLAEAAPGWPADPD